MTAKKTAPPDDAPRGITFSPATLKWTAGFIAAIFAVIVGYWQVSDRLVSSLDARWRLEQVQAAKDKEQAMHDKQVDEQIKGVAKRAEVGRAWVMYNVIEGKTSTHTALSKLCKAMKPGSEVCGEISDEAKKFATQAEKAKDAASTAGKE